MSKTETRVLIKALEPDIDLWRIVGTNDFEIRFDIGNGQTISHQSDDAGYFAKLLYDNGHYPDIKTALAAIAQGGLS